MNITLPNMAKFEMTDECNGFCVFCFAGCNKKEPTQLLSFETWMNISQKIKNFGINFLNLSGGELFMFPDFYEAVRIFKEQGFKIGLNTNGTFDVNNILPFLNQDDMLIFSIHAHTKLQDRIIGFDKAIEKVKKNLEVCQNYPVKVCINMVLINLNYDLLLDNFNYWNENYKIHQFAAFMPVPFIGNNFEKHALEINESLILDYAEKLKKIPADKLTFRGGFQNLFLPSSDSYFDNNSPDCAGGRDKIVVKANGNVYPCDYFTTAEYFCGNILQADIASIWENGQGFKFFREYKLPTNCKSCAKAHKCYGGCRAWTYKYQKGEFSDERDFRCDFIGSSFARDGINQ
ncbi:MAG: radical SAM protein [Patescibacteria group bacterium]|nr:radical SAM protein [Patescibacteria group bacterium]